MRDETKMDVYTSGVTGAEYDAGMKQLMSNKEIIVPILQMTVLEFKTCSILCSQRPFISVKYYYADYRLFKAAEFASGGNKKSSGTTDDCKQIVEENY